MNRGKEPDKHEKIWKVSSSMHHEACDERWYTQDQNLKFAYTCILCDCVCVSVCCECVYMCMHGPYKRIGAALSEYVCVCFHACIQIRVFMFACMHLCMYSVCMFVCMYLCRHR
jgi:hypothetical protein